MIAAALALSPPLLVLDEPTTALDVTVQYEILVLIRQLREELGMGLDPRLARPRRGRVPVRRG